MQERVNATNQQKSGIGKTSPPPPNVHHRKRRIGIFLFLICLAMVAGGFASGRVGIAVAGGLAMLGVGATFLFGRRSGSPHPSAARPEPQPDSKVASSLANDPNNVLVFHNVATPHGDVDHLVFRRNGALVVIGAQWSPGRVGEAQGRLLLNGRPLEKDVAEQIRRMAMWFKDEFRQQLGIRVFVHASVVFANAYVTIRRPVRGVEAVNFSYLPKYLSRLPADRRLQETVQRTPDRIRDMIQRSPREVTRAA